MRPLRQPSRVHLQETKFREAIRYYEPTVKKFAQNILGVPAIVLANLCVAYIMTSQNEEAEVGGDEISSGVSRWGAVVAVG
jgi:hypothetical protein